ncbi:MAG: hypothetical protein H6573_14230 [Lewinellaceae bacterium]|nr:hypothetical protein [Phaeodactylibacter sp.]MCB0613654.1 hypothetical protein [Phaeodactylibacter sp.]MCB9348645.1 hypothetical protein [Lewinellaceae bacterium]
MKKIWIGFFAIVLAAACTKDKREPLFDLFYPNSELLISAGQSPTLPFALAKRGINTNIGFYLQENNVDTAMITEIAPISARLTSIDGFNYDFVDRVSIRLCPDTEAPCIEADEVFYIDRLQIDRPGSRIELLPGLRNVRRDLIREKFRLEVVFFLAFTPSLNYDTRLDMTFRALQ